MGSMVGIWRAVALVTAFGVVGCSGGSSAVGGAAMLSIGDAAGSNVATSIPPITVVVGYAGLEVGALSYEHQPSVDVKRWQLVVDFGATPMSGQTFTIGSLQADAGATTMMAAMEMEELPASGGFREWTAVSGSIAIPSRVGDQVTLTFDRVPFQPATGGSGNAAAGMFTLTGRLTVADISQPLPTD
jgi:hypothetical protein